MDESEWGDETEDNNKFLIRYHGVAFDNPWHDGSDDKENDLIIRLLVDNVGYDPVYGSAKFDVTNPFGL